MLSSAYKSTGIDRRTGQVLSGWSHVEQSIRDIVTTRLMERVMLREYGCKGLNLQDAPGSPRVLMAWFSAIASALLAWEPRYRLENVAIESAGVDGAFTFILSGEYLPRGHLGDDSYREQRTLNVSTLRGAL